MPKRRFKSASSPPDDKDAHLVSAQETPQKDVAQELQETLHSKALMVSVKSPLPDLSQTLLWTDNTHSVRRLDCLVSIKRLDIRPLRAVPSGTLMQWRDWTSVPHAVPALFLRAFLCTAARKAKGKKQQPHRSLSYLLRSEV